MICRIHPKTLNGVIPFKMSIQCVESTWSEFGGKIPSAVHIFILSGCGCEGWFDVLIL